MAINIKTEKGDIRISNDSLIKLIAHIATGCYGVIGLTSGNNSKILDAGSITTLSKGIRTKVENGKLTISMHIATTYGINVHTVSESIRNNVKYQLEHITGVEVGKVNIYVETIMDMN